MTKPAEPARAAKPAPGSRSGGAASTGSIAVVPVRQGRLPVGAVETVTAAGGRAWLVGSLAGDAAAELAGAVTALTAADPTLWAAELGAFAPGRWAHWLAPRLAAHDAIVLPHSPDGRDLGPRLAAELGRPLVSSAVELGPDRALVARHGGLAMDIVAIDGPHVATLQIGARPAHHSPPGGQPGAPAPVTGTITTVDTATYLEPASAARVDGDLLDEVEADRATRDLAESTRIVAAGAGLGDRRELARLDAVAGALEATVGATRVVTDWGWLPADRQIGTTGIMVDPDLYVAVGISGAVQHTAGLGRPRHIVSVNTDPSCPMMELADLALVCDGPAYLRALVRALGLPGGEPDNP